MSFLIFAGKGKKGEKEEESEEEEEEEEVELTKEEKDQIEAELTELEANKIVVSGFLEIVFNPRSFEHVDLFLDPGLFVNFPSGRELDGIPSYIKYLRAFFRKYQSDYCYSRIENVLAEGDIVVLHTTFACGDIYKAFVQVCQLFRRRITEISIIEQELDEEIKYPSVPPVPPVGTFIPGVIPPEEALVRVDQMAPIME